jgi:hypothetical protein
MRYIRTPIIMMVFKLQLCKLVDIESTSILLVNIEIKSRDHSLEQHFFCFLLMLEKTTLDNNLDNIEAD